MPITFHKLCVLHRWEKYPGHFMEAGWNGVEFAYSTNCWASNVCSMQRLLMPYSTCWALLGPILFVAYHQLKA